MNEREYTSQESLRNKLPPGYWWYNIAAVDETPRWVQRPAPHSTEGKLFGYDERAFMARQYR